MGNLSRRDFLKVSTMAFGGSLLATVSILGLKNEVNDPTVIPVTVPIKNLKPALEGFTIAQMTDIHLEPYTQVPLVEEAVEMTNQLKPDLVVLTGDFIWHWAESAFDLAPALAKLNPRLGVYAVMGNHDYWKDIRVVDAAFSESGIPVLYNQGIAFSVGKEQLYLAGMDDGWAGKPDLEAALSDAPAGAPVVLLLHEPDLADLVVKRGGVDLQLSGHTHGGQVRVGGEKPIFLPYLGKKYDYGLYRVEDMWLYTNGGLGTISVPYRLNCPPEITLFTLTAQ